MIKATLEDAKTKMTKRVEAFKQELGKLRTGRAHPGLLDHVKVIAYGNESPLNQVASVTASDSRTLTVTAWDKNLVGAIEKAILNSDLGVTPATAGTVIRIPMPPLTEERRKDLGKVVRHEGEEARVGIRNIRRDANNHLKQLLKEKKVTEDEERRGQDDVQKLTDKFIQEVDKLAEAKEKELMEI